MIDLRDMPPCTHCYSTGHGVNACPELKSEDAGDRAMVAAGCFDTRDGGRDEQYQASMKKFRDKLPPRSEDMMPKHLAEDERFASDQPGEREREDDEFRAALDDQDFEKEEIYWKGTCEIRELEIARLRKYIDDDEWLRYRQMLNHANTQCITGHVMNPNGPEEGRWSEEIDRIERKLMEIEEALND